MGRSMESIMTKFKKRIMKGDEAAAIRIFKSNKFLLMGTVDRIIPETREANTLLYYICAHAMYNLFLLLLSTPRVNNSSIETIKGCQSSNGFNFSHRNRRKETLLHSTCSGCDKASNRATL